MHGTNEDSRSRLARELWMTLKRDQEVSKRSAVVRQQMDAADHFEREENASSNPVGPAQILREGGTTPLAGHQKRDNRRFTDPVLRVMIGREGFDTVDWSLGGLMLANYVGDLRPPMRLQIAFCLPVQGAAYFAAQVRVVRRDDRKRHLSLKFERLGTGAFDFLSGLQLQQARTRRL